MLGRHGSHKKEVHCGWRELYCVGGVILSALCVQKNCHFSVANERTCVSFSPKQTNPIIKTGETQNEGGWIFRKFFN